MNEAGVGRVLPASLHQGIADLLPSRLDFYEEWLNPKAMRDGRIGLAPLAAVLSFLRREHDDAYQLVCARAGEYAAEWTFANLSGLRRWALRAMPRGLRLRLLGGVMQAMATGTYRDCRLRVRWNRQTGEVAIGGSLFCVVREPAGQPLCDYYCSAIQRLLTLAGTDATVTMEQCRATGAERCTMRVSVS
jgi:bacteriochlorophyll 4-vinyl reductase